MSEKRHITVTLTQATAVVKLEKAIKLVFEASRYLRTIQETVILDDDGETMTVEGCLNGAMDNMVLLVDVIDVGNNV